MFHNKSLIVKWKVSFHWNARAFNLKRIVVLFYSFYINIWITKQILRIMRWLITLNNKYWLQQTLNGKVNLGQTLTLTASVCDQSCSFNFPPCFKTTLRWLIFPLRPDSDVTVARDAPASFLHKSSKLDSFCTTLYWTGFVRCRWES